jgi:transposase-like protein
MNEWRNRSARDILLAVVDGLKAFSKAIATVFPQTIVQKCIVHQLRHTLPFCSWKAREAIVRLLKAPYSASTVEEARRQIELSAEDLWAQKYSGIVPHWQQKWEQVIPFFSYPLEVRKTIYTTNAIESLHMLLRKTLKTRGHFPSAKAALQFIYRALRNISKKRERPLITWKCALSQFAVPFGSRLLASSS